MVPLQPAGDACTTPASHHDIAYCFELLQAEFYRQAYSDSNASRKIEAAANSDNTCVLHCAARESRGKCCGYRQEASSDLKAMCQDAQLG